MHRDHLLRNEIHPHLFQWRLLVVSRQEREEQILAIGGCESAFLADLIASYLFEKDKSNFHSTTNMDNWREPPHPIKGRKSSSRDEWLIPIPRHKTSWSPEGDLEFSVFSKKGHQLKYAGKESIHTPGTLRTIPAGVLNCLCQTHLTKTINSLWGGRQNLPRPCKRSPQDGPCTF